MSFGFGVGDFLAAAEIAIKIAAALSDSSGASNDYQGFIQELNGLELCLKSTHDRLKNTKLPTSSHNALLKEGSECQKRLKELDKIIEKYKERLGGGKKSKWNFRDAMGSSWQKLGWSLFQREEVTNLRARLGEHVANITLVLQSCGVHTLSQVEKVTNNVEKHVQETSIVVKQIHNAIPDAKQLGTFSTKITDVEGRIAENTEIVKRIERKIAMPAGLDFLWDSEVTPVTFIDALDRQVFIPYELCKNWQQLHDAIKLMFRGHPGLQRVNNGNFALTDERKNGALIQDISNTVEPGMKLAMSMVVGKVGRIDDPGLQRCPACQVKLPEAIRLNERMRCTVCAAWFQIAVFSNPTGNTGLNIAGNSSGTRAIEGVPSSTTIATEEVISSTTVATEEATSSTTSTAVIATSTSTSTAIASSSSSNNFLTTYSTLPRYLRVWRDQASHSASDIRFFRRIILILTDPEHFSSSSAKPPEKRRLALPAAKANNADDGIKAAPSYGPPGPQIPDFMSIDEASDVLEYSRHKIRAAYIHQEFSIQGKLAPVVVNPRRCTECLEHGDWAKCWVLLQNPHVKSSACGTCVLLGRECIPSE